MRLKKPNPYSFFLVLCLFSCKTTSSLPDPTSQEELRALEETESLVIIGTNDIHGALAPERTKTRDAEAREYERGGASILASHLKLLRRLHPDRTLWLDAGDQWQGSLESNLEEGSPMIQFFNSLKLDAAAIGNHEFDFGPEGPYGQEVDQNRRGALLKRIKEAQFPYLAANITPPLPGSRSSVLIEKGGLKIGIIGLATQDTPTTTRFEYVSDLKFSSPSEAILREAPKLRAEGAHAVVVVAHIGLFCEDPPRVGIEKNPRSTSRLRRKNDPQGECRPTDEMVRELKKLPPNTIDAVVSGHSHSFVRHFVHGIPVIQGGTRHQSFSLIHLRFDRKSKRLRPELTEIEAPIPICPKVFENQGDCNGDRPAPSKGRGKLVRATFRGEEIEEDSETESLLAPIFQKAESQKNLLVGHANFPLRQDRRQEAPLGNAIADAIREAVKADFAVVNPGGIRADIDRGPIRYEQVFRAFPFDNYVSVLTVRGEDLRLLLRVMQNGARGWFPVSGLRLRLIGLEHEAPASDLNRDGKIELWETNRLIAVETLDGAPIEDRQIYRLALPDFLVTGGDDLSWVMSQISPENVKTVAGPLMRDALVSYLKTHHPLQETQVLDPARPRLRLESPPRKEPSRKKKPQKATKRNSRKPRSPSR